MRAHPTVFLPLLGGLLLAATPAASADSGLVIDAHAWRVVARESGPVNYYRVTTESCTAFVRSRYLPPLKTTVLGWQVPDADRAKARRLKWSWRAQAL